jgi:hypothetical protein
MAPRLSRNMPAVLVSLALSFSSVSASALSVDLLFVGLNGSAIPDSTHLTVMPGDQVDVDLRLSTDTQGVSGYSLSVDFDSGLLNRLVLDSYANVLPPGIDFAIIDPRGPGDPLGEPGFVKHFTGGTFDPSSLTEDTTMLIGTMGFTVTSEITGGPAQLSVVVFPGVDEILSNELVLIGEQFEFNDITADFELATAFLAIVPEPSTALLFAVGLLGLAGHGRRLRDRTRKTRA